MLGRRSGMPQGQLERDGLGEFTFRPRSLRLGGLDCRIRGEGIAESKIYSCIQPLPGFFDHKRYNCLSFTGKFQITH